VAVAEVGGSGGGTLADGCVVGEDEKEAEAEAEAVAVAEADVATADNVGNAAWEDASLWSA
jgi:hypothetical protein